MSSPLSRIRLLAGCAALGGLCLLLGVVAAPVLGSQVLGANDQKIINDSQRMVDEGRQTFRFDTFGSEAFFGDTLQLHKAVEGAAFAADGGFGPGVSPVTALSVGLKVDMDAVPPATLAAVAASPAALNDPATTLALLKLNAVVGLTGDFNPDGSLKTLGVQCALCHSTVDDASGIKGVGHRLDGFANQDLNVGAILNLAPDAGLTPVAQLLSSGGQRVDVPTVRKVLQSWGPGKFDAELFMDGKAVNPKQISNGKVTGTNVSGATLIPPAFGMAGVNLHTWTGWGSVTYWNAFVANLEMHGSPGTFFDPRLDDPKKFPIAAANGFDNVRPKPGQEDRISPKLPALQFYQLAITPPKAPAGTFDAAAAQRGKAVFEGQGKCETCHVGPTFTEPGWNMHTAQEIAIDDFQASRSPDDRYRTSPLAGRLWERDPKLGFYHDGRFNSPKSDLNKALLAVVDHYDAGIPGANDGHPLGLSPQQKADLVEYLKSI
jgi:mono/diheme cytochrome c family protein